MAPLKRRHPMPVPSWILWQLLNVWCFVLHSCLRLAPSLEPVLSTFMIGGVFGLGLPPFVMLYYAFQLFGENYLRYFAAFWCWYFVSVTFDDSPRRPTGIGQTEASNGYERAIDRFWASSFVYNPTTLKLQDGAEEALRGQKNGQKKKKFLFAVHPHGVHCWPLNMLCFRRSPFHRLFPEIECAGLCASVMFCIPVVRETFLQMGYLDARREVAEKALDRSSLFVCTGGEKEALATKPGVDHVVLKNRKGFVRLALKKEAQLVPVFGFNCSDLYQTYDVAASFRNWLQRRFAIAIPVFHGRFFGPLPFRLPITVVVGKPLDGLPAKPPDASADWPPPHIVDQAHATYLDALQALHKAHAPDRDLVIL